METKKCKKCGLVKEISKFYKHKLNKDGYLNFCKDCVKERVKQYRIDNLERIKEYDRNRPNAKERYKQEYINIQKDEKRKKRLAEVKNLWTKRNKEKKLAHNMVQKAIKQGFLKRPNKCEICGKTNCTIQGHHTDYSKPLDVIWVCTECHGQLHKKYKKCRK